MTNGRKLRNLKASESECKYCQCPRSSQLATRGPHCPLCCPFHQSGPSSPCRCNPLTLVTPLFWRPAAALSCSNHLMDITCRDNVSWEPDSWPLEVSWQEPDALDSLTMEALYHPLSCDPRAAATNPGKFSAAQLRVLRVRVDRPADLSRRCCKSSWPGHTSLCPQHSQDTHKNVASNPCPSLLHKMNSLAR